jgi:phasin family protein
LLSLHRNKPFSTSGEFPMANATDTVKTATDEAVAAGKQTLNTAAAAGRESLDRSADAGREAFKKTVDQSVAAFGEISAVSKANIEALTESATIATEAAQTLSAQAAAFAKSSIEEQIATARKLAGVRSIQEAFDIQTGYAKSAFDAYMAEANRWSEAVQASTAQAWKPINARVQATAEQFTLAR